MEVKVVTLLLMEAECVVMAKVMAELIEINYFVLIVGGISILVRRVRTSKERIALLLLHQLSLTKCTT